MIAQELLQRLNRQMPDKERSRNVLENHGPRPGNIDTQGLWQLS